MDVAIIGGGVIGCAIARALSYTMNNVAVIEAKDDVAMGASHANSGIVHAGFDAPPGSLMARFNVEGNAMFDALCADLQVPFTRNGSLVAAMGAEEEPALARLLAQGQANGVPGLRMLTGAQARALEPALSPDISAALYAPTGGIVCPYGLTIALAENAAQNGATFLFDAPVDAITQSADGFTLHMGARTLRSRFIVNAAGAHADEVSRMAGAEAFAIHPRKGEYMLLDKSEGGMLRATVFRTPSAMGKGVLVTPTADGNLMLGPTAQDVADKEDTATSAEGLAAIRASVTQTVPKVRLGRVITSFAGLRAVSGEDFIIQASKVAPGLVQAAGICSPGLTSAPAIAAHVVALLEGLGLDVTPNPYAVRTRTAPKPFRQMSWEERRAAIEADPRYGHVICRCETVTEAEIVRALEGPLPARSVDAIKRRTRAGMGRCQGGFCSPRVMELLHAHLGIPYPDITKMGGVSHMVAPRAGDETKETNV
nr:NAD(P)/FAD-dependent oxidoreductase [Maliibacterium massiliense]